MKVMFLDIDGCLNGHDWMDEAGSNSIRRECVGRLNRIVRETGASIVISSAWRYMVLGGAMTLQGFAYMLRTHGLAKSSAIIGHTCADEVIPNRGDQIAAWLRDHPEVTRYVVIDDDDSCELRASEYRCNHPFVRPMSSVGLIDADADRAIRLLGGGGEGKGGPNGNATDPQVSGEEGVRG